MGDAKGAIIVDRQTGDLAIASMSTYSRLEPARSPQACQTCACSLWHFALARGACLHAMKKWPTLFWDACGICYYGTLCQSRCSTAPGLSRLSGSALKQGHCCFVVQVDASGQKVVTAVLEDGRRFEGDILIGADGIWSKVSYAPRTRLSGTFHLYGE